MARRPPFPRVPLIGVFALLVVVSVPMLFFIGRDFFPYVDSGQMNLHVDPPEGLRLEDAEQLYAKVVEI